MVGRMLRGCWSVFSIKSGTDRIARDPSFSSPESFSDLQSDIISIISYEFYAEI